MTSVFSCSGIPASFTIATTNSRAQPAIQRSKFVFTYQTVPAHSTTQSTTEPKQPNAKQPPPMPDLCGWSMLYGCSGGSVELENGLDMCISGFEATERSDDKTHNRTRNPRHGKSCEGKTNARGGGRRSQLEVAATKNLAQQFRGVALRAGGHDCVANQVGVFAGECAALR